jgi:hypothetical protein
VSLEFFSNFTQNFMLIRFSNSRSHIFATRCRDTRLISATTSPKLLLMHLNRKRRKLKHAEVSWLPPSREIKSFRELHSHTMYFYNLKRLHPHHKSPILESTLSQLKQDRNFKVNFSQTLCFIIISVTYRSSKSHLL